MVEVCGKNAYSDFRTGGLFSTAYKCPYNVSALVSRGNNVSSFVSLHLSDTYELAALFAWPTGYYADGSDGRVLSLMSFDPAKSGKEIYYKTGPRYWKIYRIMRVTYSESNSNVPESVEFDMLTVIPAYSCTRFIVGVHDSLVEDRSQSPRTITYSLEFA